MRLTTTSGVSLDRPGIDSGVEPPSSRGTLKQIFPLSLLEFLPLGGLITEGLAEQSLHLFYSTRDTDFSVKDILGGALCTDGATLGVRSEYNYFDGGQSAAFTRRYLSLSAFFFIARLKSSTNVTFVTDVAFQTF